MFSIQKRIQLSLIAFVAFSSQSISAQTIGYPAVGTPHNPKVQVVWNRYYDYEGIVSICKQIAQAHPQIATYGTIGSSYEGKPMPVLTITFLRGNESDLEKPGYYIDGNIHSNEIQASEVCLYTAWLLTEMYGQNDYITNLVKEKVFYIVPTINPDGRNHFLTKGNTPHSPRSGVMPCDDDRDGLTDEDGFDDLNGDGHITQMRRKSNTGRYKPHTKDPRIMIPCEPDEVGQYELLGYEGIDNDGDGMVNEDNTGYYDPNRDWSWGWQPRHTQGGASPIPFFQPETKAVRDFVYAHPNVAGCMTYHNTGGMLLRGPSNIPDKEHYQGNDIRVYDQLGKKGEVILPGYRYINTFEDLYPVFGGESDWFHGARGIISFTGELYTPYLMFNKKSSEYIADEPEISDFDKLLLFRDGFVNWTSYDHPQFGKIEVGGFKKNVGRADPGFLLESDAHRNAAFTLYHAHHTPNLTIHDPEVKTIGNGLYEILVKVTNDRITPTHTAHDLKFKINRPDFINLKGLPVLASFIVGKAEVNLLSPNPEKNKEQIAIENIPGNGEIKVKFIVRGTGNYDLIVDSLKGGIIRKQFSWR